MTFQLQFKGSVGVAYVFVFFYVRPRKSWYGKVFTY